MRPLLHADVTHAARALLRVPEPDRAAFCADLIHKTELADRYRAQTGRAHVFWGNGSLMAAARAHPLAPEPSFDDDAYCSCMEQVLRALIDWRVSQRRS